MKLPGGFNISKSIIYLLLAVAAFIFLANTFWNIFVYVAISLVLASILRPLTNRIHNLYLFNIRMPRLLAVVASFAVLLSVVTLFVVLFIPLVSEQVQVISSLDYDEVYQQIVTPTAALETWLIDNNLVNQPPGFLGNALRESITTLVGQVNVTDLLSNILGLTGSLLIGLLAVTFITFFLLYEKGIVRKLVISMIPNPYFEVSIAALYKIERLLSNYLLGLLFQMFIIFTMASTGLTLVNIKYALTIAIFAAVANLIPYAGPLLGSGFGILVAVVVTPDLVTMNDYLILIVKVVSVFSIVQVTDNIVLQPLIFSRSVKAHPLEIFVIIFAGATLGQIPGMIAAIPVYTIIRVSFLELYEGYRRYQIFKIKD